VVDQTVPWQWKCVLTEKFLISAAVCLFVLGVGTDQGLSFLTRRATNEQISWKWRIFFAAIAVVVIIIRRRLKARRMAKAAAKKRQEQFSAYLVAEGIMSLPEAPTEMAELMSKFEVWRQDLEAVERLEHAVPDDVDVDYPPQEGEEDIEMVDRAQVPPQPAATSMGEALLGALVREILKETH